jgi:hypothetical protein
MLQKEQSLKEVQSRNKCGDPESGRMDLAVGIPTRGVLRWRECWAPVHDLPHPTCKVCPVLFSNSSGQTWATGTSGNQLYQQAGIGICSWKDLGGPSWQQHWTDMAPTQWKFMGPLALDSTPRWLPLRPLLDPLASHKGRQDNLVVTASGRMWLNTNLFSYSSGGQKSKNKFQEAKIKVSSGLVPSGDPEKNLFTASGGCDHIPTIYAPVVALPLSLLHLVSLCPLLLRTLWIVLS